MNVVPSSLEREPDADGRAEIHDALACGPAQPLLHALAGHLAKAIGEAVSNGDAGDLPEPMRIAPASAASFQTFAHGGQVHDGRRADPQRAFQWVCGREALDLSTARRLAQASGR